MSSTHEYIPSDVVDMSKEKQWASDIGMMDWDSTRIVFTKRTLIEFLKYTGTTVDPNFLNISKLPKYASFGKITGDISSTPATKPSGTSDSGHSNASFRPSRKVRTAPGGETHDIFGEHADDDPFANTPSRAQEEAQSPRSRASTGQSDALPPMSTRDSVRNLLDQPQDEPKFRPTRRVREMPGGRDSIGDIL